MMATNIFWKTIIWERSNKVGKWCPYSAEVSQLLEQSYQKDLSTVWLGDADISLKIYSVNLNQMIQVSEVTGTKCPVRRHLTTGSAVEKGISWQWKGDGHNVWHPYEVEIINFIETCYQEGEKIVDLSQRFPSYNYVVNLTKMSQTNKRTRYHRTVKRTSINPYPVAKCSQSDMEEDEATSESQVFPPTVSSTNNSQESNPIVRQVSKLWNKIKNPVVSDSSDDASTTKKNKRKIKTKIKKDSSKKNVGCSGSAGNVENLDGGNIVCSDSTNVAETNYAIVDGKPWYHHWPPHTPQSKIKPVPGIAAIQKAGKARPSKKKGKTSPSPSAPEDVFEMYTEEISPIPESDEEQMCTICYEPLTSSSAYSDDNEAVKLNLCFHAFHKACLQAMYDSGIKDRCIQCPFCKKIHGEKCGMQPPGEMEYHVLPYSLPSFSECDTIRIIYNIHSGIQGPEHPHPGKPYSARGFPRVCYLPDNEKGRKVLRLLVKAWERRLIFTIGRSSTTGEENTVTWNEIHHKTEFGCNSRGHGFPDPNFFDNVFAELEAHGITDSVYNWYPA